MNVQSNNVSNMHKMSSGIYKFLIEKQSVSFDKDKKIKMRLICAA